MGEAAVVDLALEPCSEAVDLAGSVGGCGEEKERMLECLPAWRLDKCQVFQG